MTACNASVGALPSMAKLGNVSIKIASASDPDNPEWVEIGDVTAEFIWKPIIGVDLARSDSPPPSMDLSRIEHDMAALAAEYPPDPKAPTSVDAWTWTTPASMADSYSLFSQIVANLSVDTSGMTKAFEDITKSLQEFSKEALLGYDDSDPDYKPSRAQRRHRKSAQALGSGPAWRDDNRPGVRDFRRAQRRDMRRGSRH